MVKVLHCGNIINEFEFHLCDYIHFQSSPIGNGMNPLILPAMGKITPFLVISQDDLGIK